AGVAGVADEAGAALAALHEPIDRLADVLGVLAVADRAPLHEEGHAGQGRHRGGVLAAVGGPAAVAVLGLGKPLQAFADHLPVLRRQILPAGDRAGTGQEAQGEESAEGLPEADRARGRAVPPALETGEVRGRRENAYPVHGGLVPRLINLVRGE